MPNGNEALTNHSKARIARAYEALGTVKARLVREVAAVFKQRRLTQREAAELVGISQPDVSALMNGKPNGFSIERLFQLLGAMGKEIVIRVNNRSGGNRPIIRVETAK